MVIFFQHFGYGFSYRISESVDRHDYLLLGCFKSFVHFYNSILNCNISVNSYSI